MMALATRENDPSLLFEALLEHRVSAKVADTDTHRIRGGFAIEIDYIITVKPTKGDDFCSFNISKTYSAFRALAQQLKKASDTATLRQQSAGGDAAATANNPASVEKLCKFCNHVFHLVDAQKTAYLGKVNYLYVKVLAKQRKQIIDDVLAATFNYFPKDTSGHSLFRLVAETIETFFLTDHVVEETMECATGGGAAGVVQGNTSERSGHKRVSTLEGALNPLAWIGSAASTATKAVVHTATGSSSHSTKKRSPLTVSTSITGNGGVSSFQTTSNHHHRHSSVVIPITRRNRRPESVRTIEEEELQTIGEEPSLLVDDDRSGDTTTTRLPSYAKPVPTVRSVSNDWSTNNPWVFLLIALVVISQLLKAAKVVVSVDGDVFLLLIFASFCLGLHCPRPIVGGYDRPPTMKGTVAGDRSGRKLLRRSMITSPAARMSLPTPVAEEVEEEEETMGSPMSLFPEGAAIGSHNNCWSSPATSEFMVRGPTYLTDKKKIPSGEFIFPCRGIDLFLTDSCPQNVGRNRGVYGGKLRDVPTFIINFRLPWGVLLLYSEIPNRFVPFLEADGDVSKLETLKATLSEMSPPDRTVARWLMSTSEEKNKTFKIVPVVVDGPWVVKSVVGGKPALIGSKLPISYVYQAAEGKDASYLEADLDIAASSAARGILSVARSYTQVLTLNLGFVIQANADDELPEQMLMGARLHGIDPLTAPALPPMADDFSMLQPSPSDDDSV